VPALSHSTLTVALIRCFLHAAPPRRHRSNPCHRSSDPTRPLGFGRRRCSPPFPRCAALRASPLSQSTTLTHLSLSLRPAGCVADRRGPPEATIVVGAPPSRSSSSASTSPARSGGFPLSLGRPVHSLCNTVALGIGPAAPRPPARRRGPRHPASRSQADLTCGPGRVAGCHATARGPALSVGRGPWAGLRLALCGHF
jgi:hypothetical protein